MQSDTGTTSRLRLAGHFAEYETRGGSIGVMSKEDFRRSAGRRGYSSVCWMRWMRDDAEPSTTNTKPEVNELLQQNFDRKQST